MNKNLFILSACSLIISSAYAMQEEPQQQSSARPLTLQERKARAWKAYRACEVAYHRKCVEYYEQKDGQNEQEKCRMLEHVDCWKVYQEKLTEGVLEEAKEFFRPKK